MMQKHSYWKGVDTLLFSKGKSLIFFSWIANVECCPIYYSLLWTLFKATMKESKAWKTNISITLFFYVKVKGTGDKNLHVLFTWRKRYYWRVHPTTKNFNIILYKKKSEISLSFLCNKLYKIKIGLS